MNDVTAQRMVAGMLAACYGVSAGHIEPVAGAADSFTVRVHLVSGGQVFVTRFPAGIDETALGAALEFAAYCGKRGVVTPAVWVHVAGGHLTRYGGALWYVTGDAPGRPSDGPLSTAEGEVIGEALGRLHRLAADYRGPLRRAGSTWREGDTASAAARCEELLESLHNAPGHVAERRREQVSQRWSDLLSWPRRLRGGLPHVLSQQPLHGDATRPHLLWDRGRVILVGFRAVSGPVVWELAKIAFDPLTVAHSDTWPETAAAVIGAYQQENPSVRAAELAATARVALLDQMFSISAEVIDDPSLPPDTAGALTRGWDDTHETVARLKDRLAEVEELLHGATAPSRKAVNR